MPVHEQSNNKDIVVIVVPNQLLMILFVAKEKLRKIRLHKTGGGPPPPPLTAIEEAIARIFRNTPGFGGIVSKAKGDSKIVIKRGPNNNDLQAKICCAEMVAETSSLQKAVNTGNNSIWFNKS